MPAQHQCPSCGFIHDSEGKEVAPIIVQHVHVAAPAPPPAAAPPPHRSSCPVCISKGLAVHFDNPEAFNAHMEAGNHRAPGEPEPQAEVIPEQLEDFKLPDGGIDYEKLIERVAAKMPAPVVNIPPAPAPAIDYKEFVAEFMRQQASAPPPPPAAAPVSTTQEQESH